MTFEKSYKNMLSSSFVAVLPKEGQLVDQSPASLYEFAELLVEDAYKQGAWKAWTLIITLTPSVTIIARWKISVMSRRGKLPSSKNKLRRNRKALHHG